VSWYAAFLVLVLSFYVCIISFSAFCVPGLIEIALWPEFIQFSCNVGDFRGFMGFGLGRLGCR